MTNRRFKTSLLSASLVLGLATHAHAQPAPQEQLTISMPAMPLGDALRQIARQSGRSLVVDDQLIAGRTAPALSGKFSTEEAIERVLSGSGLTSRTVEGTIVVSGPSAGVSENRSPALGHDEQQIVVTGTHVRGAPPTSPLITLTRRQIDEAAPASVQELIRKLPQNVSAGVAEENFGVTGTGSDITDHGAGVNLRGLGQRATLVLVDGRRIAPSGTGSFVDVSMIPVSAIERVEILTDGASAIYGSDAVGGVVNFILRDDVRGVEPMVQFGTSTRGGGDELLASLTAGANWRDGRGLLTYEYRDEGRIRAGQRDFPINLPADWSLFPSEKRHSLYGTARQQLASRLSLDLTGMFADRTTDRSFFMAGPAVPVVQHARSRSFGGTAALQLDLGLWRAEGTASYYRSRNREREVQPLGQGFFNSYALRNSVLEFGAKADGPLVELPAGAAKLAIGGGIRREAFAGTFESPVNLPNPQSGSRNVESLYGELVVPLFGTRNRRAGLETLTATAAGRLEHYERLGSTFNPKVGLLWSPAKGLTLRSTYATSFRAPLLSESLGYYNIFLFPASLLYIDPSQAPSGIGAALIGNNPDVRPERSRSFSAGAEFAPVSLPGLNLTATYYSIRFSNRIAQPTDQVVVVGDPALEPIVTRNPAVGSVTELFGEAGQVLDFSGPGFTNGGATPADVVIIVDARTSNTAESRTSGLDIGANYAAELGPNRFRFELNLNHVFRFDDRLTSASPVIHTLNTPFHALGSRARGGASWSRGPFSAVFFVNYAGPYHDRRAGVSRKVDSYTTVDAGIAFSGSAKNGALLNKIRLALNIQNLFDRRPPRLLPEPGFTRDIGYDPVNASGRGRTISLQIRRSW
jgi:outer membrane receptor protein involved in Fe transport